MGIYYQREVCSLGFVEYADVTRAFHKRVLGVNVTEAMLRIYIADWKTSINRIAGTTGRGLNKLRTYRTFKSEFKAEAYCKTIMPLKHRSAFAKFRCGVAPLRIETGRYENLDVHDRVCPFCDNEIENETHVILECSIYNDVRTPLLEKACQFDNNFNSLTLSEKMKFLFSNQNMIRICAKTCF